jgi:hypothetical protein
LLRTAIAERWAVPGSTSDVVLRTGGHVIISKKKRGVTAIGKVQSTSSHGYLVELSRDDGIGLNPKRRRRLAATAST